LNLEKTTTKEYVPMSKLIVLTGLDGSGTTSVARKLSEADTGSTILSGINEPYTSCREAIDRAIRDKCPMAHYLFYLSAIIHASSLAEEALKSGNVYCVRYLIDTVVSHRVAGLDVRLEYETGLYRILKPDFTVFLHIEEGLRQERITGRGKGFLDKTLDNESFRTKFLKEFEFLAGHFYRIDVDGKSVLELTREIRALASL